jgi:hypothetical protein
VVNEQRQSWIPEDVDISVPSAARAYDAFLGGAHNFEVDRQFARKAEQVFPGVALACRANRAFLRRAVLYALEAVVRQFLDIGSGIPTVGNVHEVVHAVDPSCPVIYVDNEPVAVAHSEILLQDNDYADIVQADLRSPASILDHPTTRRLIDFDQPVMLLMLAVLHFIPDSQRPDELAQEYGKALSSGSHLAITHATAAARPEEMRKLEALYATSSNPAVARSPEWIQGAFGDYELVEPGAIFVPQWRPDGDTPQNPQDFIFFGGVGAKP